MRIYFESGLLEHATKSFRNPRLPQGLTPTIRPRGSSQNRQPARWRTQCILESLLLRYESHWR